MDFNIKSNLWVIWIYLVITHAQEGKHIVYFRFFFRQEIRNFSIIIHQEKDLVSILGGGGLFNVLISVLKDLNFLLMM
jgi:hypothetical protein